MGEEMKCLIFRSRESSGMKKRIGYCDIDGDTTACGGDVSFCEKPEGLRQYFREKLEGLKKREIGKD